MKASQLRNDLIKPILTKIGLYSKNAEDLLVCTACAESLCGEYIKQVNGPALGIFQMEPSTARDIENNFLAYKQQLKSKIDSLKIPSFTLEENLKYNLAFQVAMCRIHYFRVPESIPDSKEGIANYWKKYYNTYLGKGNAQECLNKWNQCDK